MLPQASPQIARSLPIAPEGATSGQPFLEWEKGVAVALAGGISISILWSFIFRPTYSAMMLEYIQKFFPVFLDNGISAIFDNTGIGDPRPRLLANLFAFVNVKMRGMLLDWGTIHPSFGVSWALFPLAVVLLFKATLYMTGNVRSAFMSAALYSVSPSLLDTLVNYYIPAKPLANILLISSIYGAARIAPHPSAHLQPKPFLGAMIVLVSTLCGLLSDETAVLGFAILPLLFFQYLTPVKPLRVETAAITGSLFAAGCVFGFTTLFVMPWINASLGQIPLDFPRVILSGVYKAVFSTEGPSVLDRIPDYSPLALLAVIISAHTIPLRVVGDIWTRGSPPDTFWRPHELASLAFLLCLTLFLAARLQQDDKRYMRRLLFAFSVFLLLQALIILPLAPWIVEVNYYAGFSSIFFALIAGHLISTCRHTPYLRGAGWLILTYFIATQYGNFVATAQRHPGFGATPLSWSLLGEIRKRIAAGEFSQVVAEHPFPNRLFRIAFEYEGYRQQASGRKIDVQPMREPSETLYGAMDLKASSDPRLMPNAVFVPKDEAEILELGASPINASRNRLPLEGLTIEGATGAWNYIRKIDESGDVKERLWYSGLMRVWNDTGRLLHGENRTCMVFVKTGAECYSRLYRLTDAYFAFDEDGKLVTRFKRLQ